MLGAGMPKEVNYQYNSIFKTNVLFYIVPWDADDVDFHHSEGM